MEGKNQLNLNLQSFNAIVSCTAVYRGEKKNHKTVRKPKTYMPFAFVTPSSPRGRKVP
jgi:hypothetical protein